MQPSAAKMPRGDRRLLYLYLLAVWISCCLLAALSVPAVRALEETNPHRVTLLKPIVKPSRNRRRLHLQEAVVARAVAERRPKIFDGPSFHARRAETPFSKPSTVGEAYGVPHQQSALKRGPKKEKRTQPPSSFLRVSYAREGRRQLEACVIPDACMAYSFGYKRTFIPDSYRSQKKLLNACLPSGYSFYSRSSPPPELQQAVKDRHAFDVIGVPLNDAGYAHFAHFLPEFARYIAVAASLFLRPSSPAPRWLCPSPATGHLTSCESLGKLQPLNPKFALSKRMLGRARSWNRAFFAMLTDSSMEHPRHVHLLPPTSRQPPLHCFRSLLTSPLKHDTSIPKHDAFFRGKVTRERISTCTPRIVVIVRSEKYRLDRTIPAPLVRRLRHELAKRIPSGTVEFFEALDGVSVREQAALMQRTDVLITVHGAELSNLIFVRRGASVLQIFPFGFRSGWFDQLMESVGARHVEAFARPDTKRFLDCVKERTPKLFPGLKPEVLTRVKQQFLSHVDLYERADSDEKRNDAARFNDLDGLHQVCTRAQQIFIDPVKIAQLAAQEARAKCEHSNP